MSDYKSVLSTLDALIGSFATQSIQTECQLAQDIAAKKQKSLENMGSHKQCLQQNLDSIHSSHQSYESLLANPSSAQLSNKYDELQSTKQRLEREIEEIEAALSAHRERGSSIEDTQHTINDLTQNKKQKIKAKIPALKHRLNLYQSLLKIEWNLRTRNKENANENETDKNILSGFVGVEDEEQHIQLKEFAFDTKEISHFDLVNEMWKLYDSEIQDDVRLIQEMINTQ